MRAYDWMFKIALRPHQCGSATPCVATARSAAQVTEGDQTPVGTNQPTFSSTEATIRRS